MEPPGTADKECRRSDCDAMCVRESNAADCLLSKRSARENGLKCAKRCACYIPPFESRPCRSRGPSLQALNKAKQHRRNTTIKKKKTCTSIQVQTRMKAFRA